jgi:hypothetical protein
MGELVEWINTDGASTTLRVKWHLRVSGRDAGRGKAGQDTRELFCVSTDLHNHLAYPAQALADTYHQRWIGSETSLMEAKSTINGAGPSTGAMLRSCSPDLVAPELHGIAVARLDGETLDSLLRRSPNLPCPLRRPEVVHRAPHK